MIRTQIYLPEELYNKLKTLAEQKEWSMAELLRRGAEYIVGAYPVDKNTNWSLPTPVSLGKFQSPAEDWREIANSKNPDSKNK